MRLLRLQTLALGSKIAVQMELAVQETLETDDERLDERQR